MTDGAPPEFGRRVALDTIGSATRAVRIEADANERVALARRFALTSLDRLSAMLELRAKATGIAVAGRLDAAGTQACVVTGEPVPFAIDEAFGLRFVDEAAFAVAEGEIELDADACDLVVHDGAAVDLGEAVAQTLGLALDPFPRSVDDADTERVWRAGEDAGPFAALKGLLADPRPD